LEGKPEIILILNGFVFFKLAKLEFGSDFVFLVKRNQMQPLNRLPVLVDAEILREQK
jgi:hypothetical protein